MTSHSVHLIFEEASLHFINYDHIIVMLSQVQCHSRRISAADNDIKRA